MTHTEDSWDDYGTEERPVVVSYYHITDHTGKHRFLTMNDYAMHQMGGASEFEKRLAAQFRSYELLGMAQTICHGARSGETKESSHGLIRRRIEQIRNKYPGASLAVEPWLPEDTSDTRVSLMSTANTTHDLFSQIATSIIDLARPITGSLNEDGTLNVAPIVDGLVWLRITLQQIEDLLHSDAACATIKAAVLLFPPGKRIMLDATMDVEATVRITPDGPSLSIRLIGSEPEYRFTELTEPFNAFHALHLIYSTQDSDDYKFAFMELENNVFTTGGWLHASEAAEWAIEGARKDAGRPPDFRDTTSIAQPAEDNAPESKQE